jgi:DNA (cytosine-5)-methyltransferase 1
MKTHLDLFSGIGGFAIAAQACGYTTIGFCEKEKYAQQILKERFGAVLADADGDRCGWCDEITSCALQKSATKQEGGIPRCRRPAKNTVRGSCPPILHKDIFQLCGTDYAGVDLLTGGFPCQPFSVAGKRKGAADDRALWPEMLRVIDGAKPAWIIGENVAGIVTMELDNILSDLEAIGYAAWPLVIPACAVDARHRRDRVWIVAHAEELHGNERGEYRQSSERQVSESGISSCCEWESELHWFVESGMGRVAHGIPHRAHRLRGLGNAIVPQVAYEIIRAIPPHIPGREIALATGAGMR